MRSLYLYGSDSQETLYNRNQQFKILGHILRRKSLENVTFTDYNDGKRSRKYKSIDTRCQYLVYLTGLCKEI